ncbi:ATP-dependent DNA helicase [Trichonephila clavipes]|nr:ATP-dependent DNA helicase [Trichonephila clavipes]
MFKIPLESERMENPVLSVTKNSDKAKVLQDGVFEVWDECTMANKISTEAVNRVMQDLRGNTLLFGGATFLFAGYFRQILPVVIKENMKAHSADSEFSKILFDDGEGKSPEVNSTHDIGLPTGLSGCGGH